MKHFVYRKSASLVGFSAGYQDNLGVLITISLGFRELLVRF